MGKGLDGCRNTFKKRAKKVFAAFCKENKPIRRIIRKDFNRKGTGTWVSISTTVV